MARSKRRRVHAEKIEVMECAILLAVMLFDRPLQRGKSVESDPINLAITALHNAFSMFAQAHEDGRRAGFDLLAKEPGIPEHLLLLIAAFATDVPRRDIRYEATLNFLEERLDEDGHVYLQETELDHDERAMYDWNMAELHKALKDPFEIKGLVEKMLNSPSESEPEPFQDRAWKKAFRFNSFDDSVPQLGDRIDGPSLGDLHEMAVMEDATVVAPTRSETIQTASPEKGTRPPKGARPGAGLKIGPRLQPKDESSE